MTDGEYRELHRELDERYRAQIDSLRAQVQMLSEPLVQLKMLQPAPPVVFQLSDTDTWNLAREQALNAAYESEDLSEAISKIKALKR